MSNQVAVTKCAKVVTLSEFNGNMDDRSSGKSRYRYRPRNALTRSKGVEVQLLTREVAKRTQDSIY
jgi:hypothetical protein